MLTISEDFHVFKWARRLQRSPDRGIYPVPVSV